MKITKEFVLSAAEVKLVMHCLDYMSHRITVHGKGKLADIRQVEKLRAEIRENLTPIP